MLMKTDVMLDRFVGQLYHIIDNHMYTDKSEKDRDYYPFIPFDTIKAIKQIKIARKLFGKNKPLFLDVGCGIGNIMLLAEVHKCNVFGIEYDEKVLNFKIHNSFKRIYEQSLSTKLAISELASSIIIADALKINPVIYSIPDIIYYYVPIRNFEKEKMFEKRIVTYAKKGCVLIANMKCDFGIDHNKKWEHLYDNTIYQKIAE